MDVEVDNTEYVCVRVLQETKGTCKIYVEFNALFHKKEISWNDTSEIPLQMFLRITKKTRPLS